MVPAQEEHPWFALQVRTRFESLVATLLHQKGYPVLLPTCTSRRQWNDRVRDLQVPLFPSYLFCRFDPAKRLPILTTPHVISVVGVGRTPVPVDDKEIAAIREVMNSGQDAKPWPYLHDGQKVRIKGGPLRGLCGILLSVKAEYRLILSVTLLRRSIAVEVERSAVVPVQEEPASVRGAAA
jgi:Transcription antiterminator